MGPLLQDMKTSAFEGSCSQVIAAIGNDPSVVEVLQRKPFSCNADCARVSQVRPRRRPTMAPSRMLRRRLSTPSSHLTLKRGGRRSGRRAFSCGSFERVSLRHGLFKGIWVVQLTIWSCEKLGGTVRAIPPCKTMWFCCLRLLWHALIWSTIALPLFVATPYFSE